MTVKDFMEKLAKLEGDAEIVFCDGDKELSFEDIIVHTIKEQVEILVCSQLMAKSRRQKERTDAERPITDPACKRQVGRPSLAVVRGRLKKDAPDYYLKLFGNDEDLKGE